MNHLQRYLQLRNITCADIAQATGIGYHSVQKTVKGLRSGPATRAAIAGHLGLCADQLFGRQSATYIRKLVREEAARISEMKRREVLAKYLPGSQHAA